MPVRRSQPVAGLSVSNLFDGSSPTQPARAEPIRHSEPVASFRFDTPRHTVSTHQLESSQSDSTSPPLSLPLRRSVSRQVASSRHATPFPSFPTLQYLSSRFDTPDQKLYLSKRHNSPRPVQFDSPPHVNRDLIFATDHHGP